ncbi:HAD-IC family P-type ATPase [Methylobacterium sp. P31]
MQRQLDLLGRQIVWLSLGVSGLVFGLGWLRGFALLQIFRSALSLAVAAVPEGLPTVATTTLALGIDDMRRRGVLIRRLDAVETLASVNVVCFDKTGTLTRNEMQVTSVACGERALRRADGALAEPTSPLVQRLFETAVLCSEVVINSAPGEPLSGSSTEVALVRTALERGIDVHGLRTDHPCLSTQHRTEADRFMFTVHETGSGLRLAVKGSPLEVLGRCRWEATPEGGRRPLTPARREAIEHINADMARRASARARLC